MKQIVVILISLMLMTAFIWPANQPGEELTLRQSMQEAMRTYQNLKTAAKGDDYFIIATHFWRLAEIFHALKSTAAPSGTQADWEKYHAGIELAALHGIGACADQDKDRIDAFVKEIGTFQQLGHKEFR